MTGLSPVPPAFAPPHGSLRRGGLSTIDSTVDLRLKMATVDWRLKTGDWRWHWRLKTGDWRLATS